MKAIRPRYFFLGRWVIMTHVLSISDKYIKEEEHWQNNPNITPRYKAVKFVVSLEDKAQHFLNE
jgi:hypothetical protein